MHKWFYISLMFLFGTSVFAQSEYTSLREGNKKYEEESFEEAKEAYLKAIDAGNSDEAKLNLGDAMFKQEKFQDAAAQFNSLAESTTDQNMKSKAYHNKGNSLLQAQQLDESIEAFKNALRANPTNEAARYNLAYAQKMKKEQEKQDQNKDQDKDQDKKDEDKKDQDKKDQDKKDKDKKDQDKKDEDKKDQDKKDQDKKDQDKKDKGDKGDEEKKDKGEPEQKPGEEDQKKKEEQKAQQPKISKADAQRMLDALNKAEKKTQAKLKKKHKGKGDKTKIEKDW